MTLAVRDDLKDLVRLGLARLSPQSMVSATGPGFLARLLGDVVYFRRRTKRRAMAARIAAAVGSSRPAAEIERQVRDVFRGGWANDDLFAIMSFARSPRRWKRICADVHIEGLHHLQDALARGCGVILWETRFGHRTLAKLALVDRGFPLTQVHGWEHGGSESWVGQHVIRPRYRRAAASIYAEIVDIQEGSLAYLRHVTLLLRRNRIVCLSSTGRFGQNFAPVELLGHPLRFKSGAPNLARASGAALIPFFCFGDCDGTQRLVIERPIVVAANGSDAPLHEAAQTYARLLEGYMRRSPGQWRYWLPNTRAGEKPTITEAPQGAGAGGR